LQNQQAYCAGPLCCFASTQHDVGSADWGLGLGIVAGAAPGLGIISGALQVDFHGFDATVLIQSLWAITIGIRMARTAFRKT